MAVWLIVLEANSGMSLPLKVGTMFSLAGIAVVTKSDRSCVYTAVEFDAFLALPTTRVAARCLASHPCSFGLWVSPRRA
jgi:Ni2+-binding GTPase involved in maturation of urease and hydrogenase